MRSHRQNKLKRFENLSHQKRMYQSHAAQFLYNETFIFQNVIKRQFSVSYFCDTIETCITKCIIESTNMLDIWKIIINVILSTCA